MTTTLPFVKCKYCTRPFRNQERLAEHVRQAHQ